MFGGAREYITTGEGSAVNSGARVERGKSAKGKCGNGWAGGSVSLVRVEICIIFCC